MLSGSEHTNIGKSTEFVYYLTNICPLGMFVALFVSEIARTWYMKTVI